MAIKYNFLSILIIFSIIVSLSFIFAAHVVKTSTGGISYNINEDTQYVFNISINNTDSAPSGNITQVNITIPSTFSFKSGTNSSSSVFTSLFMNTSTILSWTGSSPFLINGTTNNTYFAFNATATNPGNYNITVMTLNGTGTYFTNISVTVNDTTIPSVVIAYPSNATSYSSSSIDFNLTLSDNVNISSCWFTLTSGAANYTMTINSTKTGANYTNSSIADGTYTAKFYCNDTSNNLNGTEQVTFTIALVVIDSSSTTTTSTSGGGGTAIYWTSTKIIDNTEFEKGASRELGTKERIKVSVDSVSHYVGVVGLTSTTVTINVSSTPQQAILKIGEEKKFEVTDDNYYDIYVKLNSISGNKADITVKKIHEAVSAVSGAQTTGAAGENQTTGIPAAGEKKETKGLNLIWIIGIIIVLIIIVLIGIILSLKRKNSNLI